MDLAGCHIDQFIERQSDRRLVEDSGAAVAVIYKRYDERKQRYAIPASARRIVKAKPSDFAHPRDEQAVIESADHVALCLVGTGAKVAAVENASIGMDTAAPITLKTDGTAQ